MSRTFLAAILFLIAGCGGTDAPPPGPPLESPPTPQPSVRHPAPGEVNAEDGEVIVGKDPKALPCDNAPCAKPGAASISMVRDGKTLHFCSDRCLAEYRKKN